MVSHTGSKQMAGVGSRARYCVAACRSFRMSALQPASARPPGQEAFERKLKQLPAILLFPPLWWFLSCWLFSLKVSGKRSELTDKTVFPPGNLLHKQAVVGVLERQNKGNVWKQGRRNTADNEIGKKLPNKETPPLPQACSFIRQGNLQQIMLLSF